MEFQISGEWVFNGVVSIAVTFVGFWLKSVKDELHDFKIEIKEVRDKYQTKELAQVNQGHFDTVLLEIRNELKSINQKLDNKADK
ncbi:hypothetical protein HPC38_01055 [Pasteurellaceae bacterium HPA106]|uniref:hypothetical protein n=1 Tax=Spirabiliibacterium pneumoniae TaxID=221400 RepID=UPI001AACC4C3|nr:hypothetical protein [Spirabiliibacterium pneumoniae]MBE2895469.1 hypothetical protein [Spirabiliibacterium pneumoniae]